MVESVYVATVLLPKYHQLIGWNPYFYLGWPQGQFNPPASYLIYSFLYYLLSWAFNPIFIFKIMIAGFFILPGFTMYYGAKWLGLGRLSGFFAGFIAIGTAGGFETGGPLDTLYYGMYEFSVAIALIPLVLAIYHQSFVRKSRPLLLLTGVLVTFDFLLHTVAGIFLVLVLGVYTISEVLRSSVYDTNRRKLIPRKMFKFAIIILIIAGLSSFWLIPAYTNKSFYVSEGYLVNELGNYATTFNEMRLGYIFGERSSTLITNILNPTTPQISVMLYSANQSILTSSSTMFYQFLIGLALVGACVSLVRSRSRFSVLVITFLIGIFIFISLGPNHYEQLWQNPTFQLIDLRPARAAAVVRIFLALLGGAGIGETLLLANIGIAKLPRKRFRHILRVGTLVIIAFLAIMLIVNSYSLMTQLQLGTTTNDLAGGPSLTPLFSWIKQNVPNTTRIAFQEYPGVPQHLFAITPLETGDQSIGSNYGFWWQGSDASIAINNLLVNGYYYSGSDIHDTFAGMDIGYVVVWGSAAQEWASGGSTYFTLVQTIGIFDIYKLDNFIPSYVSIQNGQGMAELTSFQPEKLIIHVSNVTAGSSILVREEYFPDWVAVTSYGSDLSVNPDKLKFPLDSANFISIPLTRSGSYNITISYGQTVSQTVGSDISALSLIAFSIGSIFTVLDSNTSFPIAEYLALVVKRTSEVAKSIKSTAPVSKIRKLSRVDRSRPSEG
ncbi:MAG: glycosyltransferase family protein [Nitrososphaerales archaeon]